MLTGSNETLARAREEINACDLSQPSDIARLTYVEGSLQEAMRLWPTTPMLARESLRRDALGDDEIAPGTQVVMFNQALHRDPDTVGDADRFDPERWRGNRVDPGFNHMSNGPQDCAGRNLALFIGTAVLANLVEQGYRLATPGLDVSGPMPATLNHFRLRFVRSAA